MKALITGAGGLLGSELASVLPGAVALNHSALDVTDEDQVWRRLSDRRVDVVFHCAAMSDVDGCEREPVRARRVNALGARNIASVCGSLHIFMVAISTDYVFDGRPGQPLLEDASPKPLSVYARTKLEGEACVEQFAPGHAIVRTSWLYGRGRKSFVSWVMDHGRANRPFDVVTTQDSSPTYVRDLAPALVRLASTRSNGIFHLVSEGHATRDEWARAVLESADLDPGLVRPVESYPAPARRPRYSALTNRRAAQLGIRLPYWREALNRYLTVDVPSEDGSAAVSA